MTLIHKKKGFMKSVINFLKFVLVLVVMLFATILAFFFRLTMFIGLGKRPYRAIVTWMQSLIPLNIVECMPYQYPVTPEFKSQGHIRFTAKRTHDKKGNPLNLEEVDAMLYIARVNFPERLLDPSEATMRQLRYALDKRSLYTQRLYVYAAENDKLDRTIEI